MSETVTNVAYAPLVFSRTAYVDFRPDFIAAPSAMSASQRAAARVFVQAATDYADKLREGPRWVMFAVDQFLVAGVIDFATTFSDEHTHELVTNTAGAEQQQRRLFGFVGAAYWGNDGAFIPSRDPDFYCDIYRKSVSPRFFEKLSTKGWRLATDMAEERIVLPLVAVPPAAVPDEGTVELHPPEDAEQLWLAAAAGGGRPSLCTNAPAGDHAQLRTFDLLTRTDVKAVRGQARPKPKATVTETENGPRSPQGGDFGALADYDREEAQKKSPGSRTGFPVGLAILAGAVVLGAGALLLLRNR